MSEVRQKVADRLVREMVGYLLTDVFPYVEWNESFAEAMVEPDRVMLSALGAFGRGEIGFPELEAAGIVYVEAYQSLVSVRGVGSAPATCR